MDAGRLEALLTEVGHRILAGDPSALAALGLTREPTPAGAEAPGDLRAALSAGACRMGLCEPRSLELGELAGRIDHTLLKPEATAADIDRLCDEARRYRFASVCVNGAWVARCAEILAGSEVLVCSVVGFPLGACAPEVKAYEAQRAVDDGACEVDMVLNVGALKMHDDALVQRDIAGVTRVAHRLGARVKVILETCLLEDEEKVRACLIARRVGADFVKTSTGFSSAGATLEDVALMRRTVGPVVGVKASGGVRDRAAARAMIEAGATRIGASASIEIV